MIRASIFLLSTLTALSCGSFSQLSEEPTVRRVAGSYRRCFMGCTTLTLKRDGRFLHEVTDDIIQYAHTFGSWELSDQGIVSLYSDEQPEVEESTVGLIGSIRIKAVDRQGDPPPYPTDVSVRCAGSNYWRSVWFFKDNDIDLIDADGFTIVPNCDPVVFSIFGQFQPLRLYPYSPQDPTSDSFVFLATSHADYFFTNEHYLWKPGFLYPERSSKGVPVWDDYPLEKR